MVPRPAFSNFGLRKTNGAIRSSTQIDNVVDGDADVMGLNKPKTVVEALLQGLGRELWVAADELLTASGFLSDRVFTNMLVRQNFSPLCLAKGAVALRNAADTLMVKQWHGVTECVEKAGNLCSEIIPQRLMQEFAGLFIFFMPLPASELPEAADLLRHIGLSIRQSAAKVQEETLITFRYKAVECLHRSAQAFGRASVMLVSSSEDLGGGVTMPPDPRIARGLSGETLSEGFESVANELLDTALQTAREDSKVHEDLIKVHSDVARLTHQEDRHAKLKDYELAYRESSNMTQILEDEDEKVKMTVSIWSAKNLRNADWGGKSDPYCTCQLSNMPETKFKTEVVENNLDPVWNARFDLDYVPGKHLEFVVFDKDLGPKADDLLGRCMLKHHVYYPRGYDGHLTLVEAGKGVTSKLHVSVFVPHLEKKELVEKPKGWHLEKLPVYVLIQRLQGYDGLPLPVHFRRIQNHLNTLASNMQRSMEYLSQLEREFDPTLSAGKEAEYRTVCMYLRRLRLMLEEKQRVLDGLRY